MAPWGAPPGATTIDMQFSEAKRSSWVRYGGAVAIIGVAALLRLWLEQPLAGGGFMIFCAAVIIASWFGGLGPSLVALVSSLVISAVLFAPNKPPDPPLRAKVRDDDAIRITVDRNELVGSVDLVGEAGRALDAEAGTRILSARPPRGDLAPDPALPTDTRLWAALQAASGGTWGGCVYDVDRITAALASK
jgi:hypothetical protein